MANYKKKPIIKVSKDEVELIRNFFKAVCKDKNCFILMEDKFKLPIEALKRIVVGDNRFPLSAKVRRKKVRRTRPNK